VGGAGLRGASRSLRGLGGRVGALMDRAPWDDGASPHSLPGPGSARPRSERAHKRSAPRRPAPPSFRDLASSPPSKPVRHLRPLVGFPRRGRVRARAGDEPMQGTRYRRRSWACAAGRFEASAPYAAVVMNRAPTTARQSTRTREGPMRERPVAAPRSRSEPTEAQRMPSSASAPRHNAGGAKRPTWRAPASARWACGRGR